MQKDLEDHHVFLNDDGFHDHMPHHLLVVYGTGASVADITKAYAQKDLLQRPALSTHEAVVSELRQSWSNAAKYLGKEEFYPDFLQYFQTIIQEKGYESVVNEYLFKGDAAANDLLLRLHAGVLHPLIQLMYGLEWKQPAVVAEALAETSVHEVEHLDELLLEAERRASTATMPSILSIFDSLRGDALLSSCVRITARDKIADGILQRAKEPMLAVLERVRVTPETLEERTAEMFHVITYIASGAAMHPPRHVKYDFFLMHHVNSSLFYLTVNRQPWIHEKTKVRLLEWKIRMDLIQCVARACPAYSLSSIQSYTPKIDSNCSPREIAALLHDFGDDGHAIKQARPTAVLYELMQQYKEQDWAVLKDEDVWRQVQSMVADAVQGPGRMYVRTAGLKEAWEDVPDQSAPKRSPEVLRSIILGQ